ncbi:MAG: MbnP family protein [Bacteroidia bacterium]
MKRHSILYLLPALLILAIVGCKDDPPTPDPAKFQLKFAWKWGNQDLVMDQFYDNAPAGRRFSFQTFKYYISNLELIKSDQSTVSVNKVALFDLYKPTALTMEGEVPVGNYTGFKFALGLDSLQNGTAPSDYPVEHPMSSVNGMYWSWFTNYIFVKIEGSADTIGGLDPDIFLFHVGLDSNRQDLAFTGQDIAVTEGATTQRTVNIDLQRIFFGPDDTIFLPDTLLTHTTDDPALASRVMRNLKAAMQ